MKILTACLLSFLCLAATGHASEITIHFGGAVYGARNQTELKEISLTAGSTLLDALVAAGGFSEAAAVRSVHVKRMEDSGPNHLEIDAIKCLQNPKEALILKNGDTIWVPEIIDAYPAPHYYNRLLFEWAFLKLQKNELPTYWTKMIQHIDPLGHQKKTRFKEWSEQAD